MFIFAEKKTKLMNKQITHKGAKIAYTITGKGEVLVLLHGFLEDLSMWDEFSVNLSATNKVIAVDLPGFGKSGMISNNHSMSLMADVVFNVLQTEEVSKCTIIGHSMGGYVALAFANMYQTRLNSIVLFHSQAAEDDAETKNNRDRTIKIVENNHGNFISSFIPLLFTDKNAVKFKKVIDNIVERAMLTKNEAIIAALAGMRDREDHLPLLSQLDIPVLFIAGKQDSRIPLNKIIKQIELPKISESLILDNVGHMGFIEANELTYNAIIRFVNR